MSQSQSQTSAPLTISWLGKVGYFLLVASTLVLALTGVLTFATGHAPMTHWTLMLHVSAAPVFAISLALVALTWSDRCRFGCTRTRQSCVARALLWLILLVGLVVILTGVVPMTPLFGTTGQHFLYLTHRYTGITLACLVVLHLVNLVRAR
jgi:cytochrome b561